MFSAYQRVNSLSSLLSSCLLGLLGAIALSSFVFTNQATGTVSLEPLKVRFGASGRFPAQEWAFVRFDVDSDLTPLFNWNTKQLFVYLAAEYTNSKGVSNDVVLWDRIVLRKEDAHLKIAGAKNKYAFRDYSRSFRNATDVVFSLRYNVMPYVGVLTEGVAARSDRDSTVAAMKFPELSRA
ncbi:signal peptidase subunit [Clavulina sp. PMI_390]|nr:signal peptidase subunit [Clavulina sp. PMI_390]